ncbi:MULTISPECIES: bifunctional DNA primase/polymerase [Rhodococcus]|uniref:Bifunctional DNA primase/polymerase n=1 Tax=Rhodococcus qingshengii JCM 15477 TaxID=1303681 RepID=A0AB38R6J1_RHOSG|nr:MULTISPECIES: bifunctional DNA primase/polymerase [Rhodococcus]UPU40536.1 bifunctional DNA primase/polymerase [Rhodococcus qingshengii JCM 15477]
MKSAARQSKSTPGSTAPPAGPFAQHAPALAADGWAVFPLVPRDKTPYAGSHGHLDATTDQVQIERWTRIHANGNIGIRPAVGMLVVDIDSAALLAPWMNEHGLSLPPTRVVRTNRGSHYYYTFSSERPLLATIPGVDLKTSKGFVLAPGSVHKSGRIYRVWRDLPITELPAEWLEHIQRPEPKPRPPVVTRSGGAPVGTPGLRLVRLLGVKAEGERRGFLMYAIGEAYRVYGGSAELIERLCNTAISIGLSPTEVDAARQYIEEQETS